jgi:hypothetical protein
MTKASSGRPMDGFTRSEDAACIFRELRRRGLTVRLAEDCLQWLMGVSKSNVQKYLKHPIKPVNADHDTLNARFALAKFLDSLGDIAADRVTRLESPARGIVREIAKESGRTY